MLFSACLSSTSHEAFQREYSSPLPRCMCFALAPKKPSSAVSNSSQLAARSESETAPGGDISQPMPSPRIYFFIHTFRSVCIPGVFRGGLSLITRLRKNRKGLLRKIATACVSKSRGISRECKRYFVLNEHQDGSNEK